MSNDVCKVLIIRKFHFYSCNYIACSVNSTHFCDTGLQFPGTAASNMHQMDLELGGVDFTNTFSRILC
jgi:hypothetical protein